MKLQVSALTILVILNACNPVTQAKEAIQAKQTKDSILQEFIKVNESLKESNRAILKSDSLQTERYKRLLDSISAKDSI